ncbi:type I DNA topoisomerase [Candidatus Albibeggiatoa sp. nov. NOAA]|uniref:type I DNA topoisomerase n=1 Tax=Candidatus Albibeggiatoa sp. nov. NOAA TaxID=3162724 RepID=UPI0032F7D947|nr:type I DNA topoisomerase [Thiotrichaceae bacterium]
MSKHLVIVESPAKAKTIKKYLGKDFEVLASYGHVRDLLPKKGAVEPDNDFAMHYEMPAKSGKHVDAISRAMKKADVLYLATDPDREGEAISWHLCELLQERNLLQGKPVHRVVFHEITKSAIQDAVANPRDLSTDMIDAQQARRALDYLVGFNLSPVLWYKVRQGLSAGRVQSPALRLIVEREIEIEQFKPKEYWTIEADNKKDRSKFTAKLTKYADEKITQFKINNEADATRIRDDLLTQAQGKLQVIKVEKKQRRRQPAAPFTTSTLQQEAARKLGFTTKRTMMTAQKLYEGIDTGEGAVGLITYMRTDSVNLAKEAVEEIRDAITQRYGKENLPSQPREFKTKSKNAQEAHEAVRPTSAMRHPDEIKSSLTQDQYKLYNLIWKRTVACQMIHATMDTVAVDLACGTEQNIFRANGSVVAKPGFMLVYLEGEDDKKEDDASSNDEKLLPEMKQGDLIDLLGIRADQHFTEPPPRYTEASLVKSLEAFGIGRPSTYASIISTLQQREYVVLDKKRFFPTDVGRIVNKLLTEHFTQYVDYDFTAKLEDSLDAVSRGEKKWKPLMKNFWGTFKNLVDEKMETVDKKDVTQEPLDEKCPKCGAQLVVKLGKSGRFVACTAYPDCDYTRNVDEDADAAAARQSYQPQVIEGRSCPLCGSELHLKSSRSGSKFVGCSQYPKCKHVEAADEDKTGITCPGCQKGQLIRRKSRFGTYFYSCDRYPDCKYAVSHPPLNEPCPKCGWPILTLKTTKRWGTEKVCPQKECDFKESVQVQEPAESTQ